MSDIHKHDIWVSFYLENLNTNQEIDKPEQIGDPKSSILAEMFWEIYHSFGVSGMSSLTS